METDLIIGIRENNAEERARLPLQRSGQPGEIAAVVELIACPSGSSMVGQIVSPDGGAVIQP
jgi:hypothetical protein